MPERYVEVFPLGDRNRPNEECSMKTEQELCNAMAATYLMARLGLKDDVRVNEERGLTIEVPAQFPDIVGQEVVVKFEAAP